MHRNSRTLTVLALVALAIGCQATTPTRTTKKAATPAPAGQSAPGPSSVPVEANVGRLVGQLLGPRSGLVSNNAASVLTNGGTGLVSNNAASYAVLGAKESSGPVAGAEVTVVDELGTVVSEAPVKTDAEGRFTFPRLKDSGPLVFIQATYSEAGRTIVLVAAATAPRTLGDQTVQVDAASTLVARKVRVLLEQRSIQSADLRTPALAAMAVQLGAVMTEKAVVAAAILDAPQGAAAFDAMLVESPALQQRLSAGVTGALSAVAAPAPRPSLSPAPSTSPAPVPSDTPRPRASKTPKPSPVPTPTPSPVAEVNLGVVSSFVGSLTSGAADGQGADAAFLGPDGVAIAADGTMYVSEKLSHRIRRATPDGVVTTIAGSGSAGYFEGRGTQAYFDTPEDLALDGTGRLYVADAGNHAIRMIDLTDPTFPVTTFAGKGTPGFTDGLGRAAAFDYPGGLAVGADGSVYVSDYDNDSVRRISPAGQVSTVAGDGIRATVDGAFGVARFKGPDGICVDKDGQLYVAEYDGHTIRKISTTGLVSTVAGDGIPGYLDGPGASARFNEPTDVVIDAKGRLYVADLSNHRIRRILPEAATRPVDTLAGSGVAGWANGLGIAASLSSPASLAIRAPQTLFVTDIGNHMVRQIE